MDIKQEILTRCNKLLELSALDKNDRDTVVLIKSQLDPDWETPLRLKLNELILKYRL